LTPPVHGPKVGVLFMCVALGLANKYCAAQPDFGVSGHYAGLHPKMGLSVFILIWFQASARLPPKALRARAVA